MSFHETRSRKSSDPYAGQYPPPPPLSQEDLSIEHNRHHEPFYLIDPSSHHSIPTTDHERRSSHHDTIHSHHTGGDYDDPDAVELREYLYAERQEKLRKRQQEQLQKEQQEQEEQEIEPVTHQQDMPSPILPSHPPMFYSNAPAHSLSSPILLPPHRIFNQHLPPAPFPQSGLIPSPFGISPFHPPPPPPPLMPIMGDQEKYNYVRNDGCCCGVSFCSCFWTLLLFILFLAGIALIIIATRYVSDMCNNESILCGKTMYNGFLYGGIAVAGLAGLIVLWRIVRWSSLRFY
ncbi:hypothetical protein BCV72DRAFT_238870 [Rhizopus microsporus var. microsporus]|uniref:Uncharacterized protein n=2 Tax=Rhizopus microsporus TaxID=58291 RepID=A0A2G4SPN9_RHIZD|nr:uncharacterized protein RHIMIDRAFT_34151 [Rhizopus microsporus ATCC 52813]ORE10346.1 hypothetical protein BCV72DRAFT_238870 [Rhizopus microsporus var. microsporus]PHZ10748.1 hypothetical protein RHIMIDRAFT_34151 [Rhizopus microsporus ATCC 52813]